MPTKFQADYNEIINAFVFGTFTSKQFFRVMHSFTIQLLEDGGYLTEDHRTGGELAEEGAKLIETTYQSLTAKAIEVAQDRAAAAQAA